MGQNLRNLNGKVTLLIAVVLSAVVGGVSSGLVRASIPDANGDLHTCYLNDGGNLRIIDTTSEGCANGESSLNLSQALTNGSTAYFRVKDGSIDTAALRNIVNYEWYDGTGFNGSTGYCLQTSFEPSIAYAPNTSLSVSSFNTNDDNDVSEHCDSNFNAFLGLNEEFRNGMAWFSK